MRKLGILAATIMVVASVLPAGQAGAATSGYRQKTYQNELYKTQLAYKYLMQYAWNKAVWENALEQQRIAAAAKANAARHRQSDSNGTTHKTRHSQPVTDGGAGRHYYCPEFASSANTAGDFAVPCYIIGRESGGSYTADNPHSSAYGAYQIMNLPPGTSPAEQDRIARGMALCNWTPPNYCAG